MLSERQTSSSRLLLLLLRSSFSFMTFSVMSDKTASTCCVTNLQTRLERTPPQTQKNCSFLVFFFCCFSSLHNEFHSYLVTGLPDSLIRHNTSARDCSNLRVRNLIKLCHSVGAHRNARLSSGLAKETIKATNFSTKYTAVAATSCFLKAVDAVTLGQFGTLCFALPDVKPIKEQTNGFEPTQFLFLSDRTSLVLPYFEFKPSSCSLSSGDLQVAFLLSPNAARLCFI